MLYLSEQKIGSVDELDTKADAAAQKFRGLSASIKAMDNRLDEITARRSHIANYVKTKDTYVAYRKAGYSKKFLEQHRAEIELHKAAKAAFDKQPVKRLPRMKDLNTEYTELLEEKKRAYAEYRTARDEMQELLRAQKNVERFFAEDKKENEKDKAR